MKPYVITKILDDQNNLIFEHVPVPVCTHCEQQDLATKAAAEQAAQQATALAETADAEAQLEATFAEQTAASEQPDVAAAPAYAPRVLSAQNSFLIADALKSSIWGGGDWKAGTGWNGTAYKLKELKRQDLSGKTGTTNDVKDAWFSGFSPDLVVTSWVGFDDAESRLGKTAWNNNLGKDQIAGGESGAKTALPAWQEFVGFALKDKPQVFVQPPVGITSVRIDLKTGLLTQATDNSSGFEFFIQGTEPKTYINSSVQQLPTQNNQQQQEEIELF